MGTVLQLDIKGTLGATMKVLLVLPLLIAVRAESEATVYTQPKVYTKPIPVLNQPMVHNQPIVYDQPIVYEQPMVHNQPIVYEQPMVHNPPIVYEQPMVHNQPIVYSQPIVQNQYPQQIVQNQYPQPQVYTNDFEPHKSIYNHYAHIKMNPHHAQQPFKKLNFNRAVFYNVFDPTDFFKWFDRHDIDEDKLLDNRELCNAWNTLRVADEDADCNDTTTLLGFQLIISVVDKHEGVYDIPEDAKMGEYELALFLAVSDDGENKMPLAFIAYDRNKDHRIDLVEASAGNFELPDLVFKFNDMTDDITDRLIKNQKRINKYDESPKDEKMDYTEFTVAFGTEIDGCRGFCN